MSALPVQNIFLPDSPPPTPIADRDAIKAAHAAASCMDALAEQARFANRNDAARLWQNAAANKRSEAQHMAQQARARGVIPKLPNTHPVLNILARHGRLGSTQA